MSRSTYVGGICQCVPSFTRSVNKNGEVFNGILYHMSDQYETDSFDVGVRRLRLISHFVTLLQGDSMIGREFRTHFTHMRREVHGDTPCDEIDDHSPFKSVPEGAGVVTGKALLRSQHVFTETR